MKSLDLKAMGENIAYSIVLNLLELNHHRWYLNISLSLFWFLVHL